LPYSLSISFCLLVGEEGLRAWQPATDDWRGAFEGQRGAATDMKISGTDADWENGRQLIPFLAPFYNSTLEVSGTSYVTIATYFNEFNVIRAHLENSMRCGNFMIFEIAQEMKIKYK
ncbi:hypothetical protein Dimus_026654, partial [Dionaea muscipula]